jgi:hypothetical protein
MCQTASNLAVRFARAQPRIEGAIGEQGVSQGIEPVTFVYLAEFGRGSKRRNGPAIGFNRPLCSGHAYPDHWRPALAMR